MKKEKQIKSSIVRDSINTFGTNAIGAVITLISSFLVLNRVPISIKGQYNTVQLWGGGFSSILGLTMNAAVTYFVARYTIQNTKRTIKRLTLWISAAIAVIGTLIVTLFRTSPSFYETPVPYLAAIVIYAVSSFVFNISTCVLRGENKFKSYNMLILLQKALVTILAIMVFLHPSAVVWVWGTIAISIFLILLSLRFIKRWNGPMPRPAQADDCPIPTESVVKYSLKSHVSTVLNYLNTNVGNYIVQGRFGQSIFGVYNTAYTLMQQVWILPDAVSLVIMTRIAAMQEQCDKQKLTIVSCKIVTYITAVTAVLLVWAANLLFPILFPKYVGALDPLKYLIIGGIFISYAKVLNNSIAAYGRPELNIIPTALGIASNLLFCFLLIPLYSVNGVAMATSISLSLQGLVSIVIFCTYTKTPYHRLFIPSKSEIAMVKNIFKK